MVLVKVGSCRKGGVMSGKGELLLPSLVSADDIGQLVRIASRTPGGKFVEVGVYQGGTASVLQVICHEQKRELHLFDTFSGIPEKSLIDRHEIGDFADVSREAVQAALPDAVFHVGVFPQTLPDDLDDIAFVHVDCDNFASVTACCKLFPDRMVYGGVIYFDDYGCLEGATLAVDMALGDSRVKMFELGNGKAVWVVR